MNCASCGKPLKPNTRFCNGCGKPVAAAPIAQSTPPAEDNKIVCVSCKKPLKPNQRFCNGCGTAVSVAPANAVPTVAEPPPQSSAQPASVKSPKRFTQAEAANAAPVVVPVTSTPVTLIARDFRCNGCGAPLKIPKNSKGVVICPSCRNECVLEGLAKNAEIAAKENINSGVPLSASPVTLNNQLVSSLYESPYIPLDVLDKAEVIREERYCVPAYCFYCNGTASFTYETGVQRSQTYTVDRGDSVEIREKTRTEWQPGSSSASITETVFAPGEKKLAQYIQQLYMQIDQQQLAHHLIDIEELDFPPDVVTYDYNLPQPMAFNEYVKPYIEKSLQKKAESSIRGNVRNFSIGGSNIQKDIVRVFLGLYRVVYRYGNREYSMWVTGDGQKVYHDELPLDSNRKAAYDQKNAKASVSEKKVGCWITGISVIPVLFGLLLMLGSIVSTDDDTAAVALVGVLFLLLGVGIYSAYYQLVVKRHNDQVANDVGAFQIFDAQRQTIVRQFNDQKKTLRGIYENLAGHA